MKHKKPILSAPSMYGWGTVLAEKQRRGKRLVPGRTGVRCASAVLLLFVIAFGLNIHLFFLQIWGWSGMMLDYRNETGSWIEAAGMTFGGEAPCNVCINVETAIQASEVLTVQPNSVPEGRLLNWLFVLPVQGTTAFPSSPPVLGTSCISPLEALAVVIPPDFPPPRSHRSQA